MTLNEKLNKYLDRHLNKPRETIGGFFKRTKSIYKEEQFENASCDYNKIDNYIERNKEETTFQTRLFKYIDEKQLKDSEVYNKVGVDRRLFSKIRSNKDYHPSKETVILLGIALKLTEEEMENLLISASYSLPKNTTFDLIIRFCFKEKIYNLNQINEFLYDHNCKILN